MNSNLLLALALVQCVPTYPHVVSKPTGTTIYSHPGGFISAVVPEILSAPGPIRIVRHCYSACTAVLSRVDMCTERDAMWGFHGAHIGNTYANLPEYDQIIASWYTTRPGMVEWFLAGNLAKWRDMRGWELHMEFGVPLCGEERR